ncbi:MAG: anion transporter [Leptospiraceae bacterium]|nr:anion transporter [Leptospiraceae bacterium]MDW8306725.1 anion transporter [Leptospiraceae bacterium]
MTSQEGVLLIFLLAYVGLALGRYPLVRLDRTGIALVGAIALLAGGFISRQEAREAIDDSTIILLFSLMLLSGQLHIAGFYDNLALRILHLSQKPKVLLALVLISSGITASLFTNDVVCVAFTPVILELVRKTGQNPIPYLLAIATGSNSGGVATLIGNPQNVLIGEAGNLSFYRYSLHMALPTVWSLGVNYLVLYFLYRTELSQKLDLKTSLPLATLPPLNEYIIRKTLVYTVIMLIAFFVGMPRDISALVAAGAVLVSRKTSAERLYPTVDFKLLILFVSLFILTGALEKKGILKNAIDYLSYHGWDLQDRWQLTLLTVALSNMVSNVPAVMLLKFVPGENEFLWELLAFTSTLAGNLTILGSIANLIVLEKAREAGYFISFGEYLRMGFLYSVFAIPGGIFLLAIFH